MKGCNRLYPCLFNPTSMLLLGPGPICQKKTCWMPPTLFTWHLSTGGPPWGPDNVVGLKTIFYHPFSYSSWSWSAVGVGFPESRFHLQLRCCAVELCFFGQRNAAYGKWDLGQAWKDEGSFWWKKACLWTEVSWFRGELFILCKTCVSTCMLLYSKKMFTAACPMAFKVLVSSFLLPLFQHTELEHTPFATFTNRAISPDS